MMNYSTGYSLRPYWLPRLICCTALLYAVSLGAQVGVRNLMDLSFTQHWPQDHPKQSLNLLWQPELEWEHNFRDETRLSVSLSSQSRILGLKDKPEFTNKLYRAWTQVDKSAWSLCVGLQRINFGTAELIRPEQWFDRLSPLDESEETEGVLAALGSIPLGSTGGLKLWAIHSEDECRGNEVIPSVPDRIEPGGRLELPVGPVFTGISYHYRRVTFPTLTEAEEHRLGFDLRWDGSFGAWLESSGSYYPGVDWAPFPDRQLAMSLGTDYTVSLGSGLYLRQETGWIYQGWGNLASLHTENVSTAFLATYPLSLVDNLQVLSLYDWSSREANAIVQVSRVYDYWSFYLSASQTMKKHQYPEIRLRIALNI